MKFLALCGAPAFMSLVVGFPSSDGVVIACDCASTARVNGSLTRQKFFCDKFRISPEGRWACSWVGSRASIIAARKMSRLLDHGTAARLSQSELMEQLSRVGDESYGERRQEDSTLSESASCLVAYDHGPGNGRSPVEMYELIISSTSTCTRIRRGTPKYLGDYVNPAAFFGWSLYGGLFPRRELSVEESAFLAGFVVSAAHAFNPMAIDGLAVLVCKPGCFRALEECLLEEITRQSDKIGKNIWGTLHSRSRSFAAKLHTT